MVEMTLEPTMLAILASMKGKMFKSYEGCFPVSAPIVPDRVRINLGSFSVDLKCWYKEVDNWREVDGFDPPCVLSCAEAPSGEPFTSKAGNERAVLVGERITGVDVVSYVIDVGGMPDAIIDMAIVIRTKRSTYTFSRGVWFDTSFYVAKGDDVDIKFSEEKCVEGWAGEPREGGSSELNITRKVTSL